MRFNESKQLIDIYTYICYNFVSVIDATAKPEAGVLDGSLKWLGSYDECKRTSYHNESRSLDIKGKYSLLSIPIGASTNAVCFLCVFVLFHVFGMFNTITFVALVFYMYVISITRNRHKIVLLAERKYMK